MTLCVCVEILRKPPQTDELPIETEERYKHETDGFAGRCLLVAVLNLIPALIEENKSEHTSRDQCKDTDEDNQC